ncbi:MAG TPA: hemerythrin domain-containing protein [Kiloniellaceae bacterium]
MRWKDSFSVGIKALDDDHRLMVQLINAACIARHDGGRTEALRVHESLAAAAEAHFEREEDVLRQLGRGTPAQAHGGGSLDPMTAT